MKQKRLSIDQAFVRLCAGLVLLLLLMAVAAPIRSAYAASTINVNTTADENGTGAGCSLREALTSANTNSNFGGCTGAAGGPFTVTIPAGTYSLTAGELQVGTSGNTSVTISGAGAASTIIRQSAVTCTSGVDRVFDLDPSVLGNVAVSISGVTISNGAAQAFGGGAILGGGTNDSLILSNAIISGNCTSGFNSAAGISWSPAGNVTISNTTFANNASGQAAGAIFYTTGNGSTLTITSSTFAGNSAGGTGGTGGALFLGGNGGSPTFTIDGSVFTNNQAANASGIGGAIYVGGGTLNLGSSVVNIFKGNIAGISTSGGLGVRGGTANATNNWWSCNGGPGIGSGCDRADNSGGTLTFTPWVVLSNTASPNPIKVNQTTTLAADFLHNSSAGALTLTQIAPLIGRPVSWGSPVKGSLSGAQTSIQSNGTATATFTANAAGAGSAVATVDNGAATGSITINKANTTTTITAETPDPSVTGQPVVVSFTVVSETGSTPTAPAGNVTVSDGTISCTGTVATGQCSLTFTSAGSKSLTATYAGDANFNGSTSAAQAHTVNKADTTTTITSDNPDPSVVGEAVTVNYTIAAIAPGSGTLTGNVTVSDGAVSCTGTVAAGQCSLTFTSAGSKSLTATYAGDANYNGSTSSSEPHTVNLADTTPTITSDTPDPSAVSQAVTVTYTVVPNAPGAGTPTGNVTVSDGVDSCTGTVAAGQCAVTLTTAGSRTLTATYAGDGNFNGSTSAGEPHTVGSRQTTTAISSDTPDPSVVGQAVTVQYSVTPAAGGTPTGSVTVSDGTVSCTGTVAAGQCSLTFTSAGAKFLTATYAGDVNFDGSTSAAEPHTVNPADTTTTIVSDTPDPSLLNQTVTVAYTVVPVSPGAGTPTGNVTVSDGTDSCTGTVAAGQCLITLTTAGARTLTATYSGDSNFAGSTSAGEPHTVNIPDSIPPDTTITTAPANPSHSTSATFAFSGTDDQTPAGSLTFECQLDGSAFSACVSPVSYSGLALGSHTFAVRAIDSAGNVDPTPASYTWWISATTSLLYNGPQVVNAGNSFQPAARLSSPAAACIASQPISFSLGRNPLTGMAGAYSLGTATTNTSGQATLAAISTTGWLEGIYDITASFAGASICEPSSYTATLTVATPGESANGGGWYTLSGSGRINFGFVVRKVDNTCTTGCAYRGQLLLINNGKWRLKGTLSSYVKLATGYGAASGVGDLYWWDPTLNGGLGDWALAQSGVSFTINFYDSGKTGKASTDAFGINIQYSPVPPQPASLPNSSLVQLKGGDIKVK